MSNLCNKRFFQICNGSKFNMLHIPVNHKRNSESSTLPSKLPTQGSEEHTKWPRRNLNSHGARKFIFHQKAIFYKLFKRYQKGITTVGILQMHPFK